MVDVELEVLRQQLADEHRAVHQARGQHAAAQMRRQRAGARHHTLGIVARHVGMLGPRRRRGDGFLHIHQTMPLGPAVVHAHQHGEAQPAERAAALAPVGGVDQAHRRVAVARPQRRGETPDILALEQRFERVPLVARQRPEALAERDGRLGALDPLVRQVLPGPPGRLSHHQLHGARHVVAGGSLALGVGERRLVAIDHMLENMRRRHAGKVGAARRHGQRQSEADDVVGGVADHRLVEVANLDGQRTAGAGDRAQIADVAVAADPHRRSLGQRRVRAAQPLVEFCRAAPDIGMGGRRHLAVTLGDQKFSALAWVDVFDRHCTYIAASQRGTSLPGVRVSFSSRARARQDQRLSGWPDRR
jgi:hypothetical protein